ncbi:MAG: kinase [Candidatus Bathyarchaeota archaeon]|uniref:beta-ribofuranosylaminobenzene 5'-phosphate synthase family protein n=1 Tax=Candidatus Bathycorpusculum sp. TaxID=2994959 RepID=UPI00281C2F3A|nr:kinase [Candidatus Termiticorpusculum sp.]MCL2291718.1 kinase [Candidatus Termiticorpusculum sp.]
MKVYVKTPARLHFGLIDLTGDLGRMFGGLGVAINQPNVIVSAQKSSSLTVTGKETELATIIANRFFNAYSIKPNVHIHVEKTIPAHTGLGSGTQLTLAIATALAKLTNINVSTANLALAMGRVQRTGVGTAIFQNGGFIVDGGKKLDQNAGIPPVIYQKPFPKEWSFIIAQPNVQKGLSNSAEKTAFNNLPPMQPTDAANICRLTLLKLLPALEEKDLENFGQALTAIQITIGNYFASVQGGTYSNTAVANILDFFKHLGIHGYGQSSWGPTIYGVVEQKEAKPLLKKIQTHLTKGVGGEAFVTKANNKGAIIKKMVP